MQFTTYFSQNININGPTHLDGENQKLMMNIVATGADKHMKGKQVNTNNLHIKKQS